MTTATTSTGKRVAVSTAQKARMLTVFDIGEAGRLAVTSGTKPNTAYVVHHDGWRVTSCPCRSVSRCSHAIAGDWYLEARRRATYSTRFDPHGCDIAMW
jgi:hypothetical protein